MVLEKTLVSPLDSKEIKPVNPEETDPEYSLEGLMPKLKRQSFGHPIWRADSLEKTLMLEKIEGRRRRGWQRRRWLDANITSMDMSLSKLRDTVKDREVWCAAVYSVTRVRHHLGTEQTTCTQHLFISISDGLLSKTIQERKAVLSYWGSLGAAVDTASRWLLSEGWSSAVGSTSSGWTWEYSPMQARSLFLVKNVFPWEWRTPYSDML